MLASLFSKPQSSLSVQAKRLVAMRFLIYTGFQTSYFIGVIGTLTYADDASVGATSLAVLFMNVFVILGSFAGGAVLDAWGPCRHFRTSIVGTLTTGAAILAFGSATGTVLAGAVLLGFVMGFAQPIATSYPAYLTDDPVELKDINSAITMFSNVSIIVGPTLGGFVAAAASSRAVFVLMMLFTVLALVAGWGFRPRTGLATAHEGKPAIGDTTSDNTSQCPDLNTSTRATFATSIKTVFTNSVLALLFCIIFLSNFGYGAFDPLESFFYRDVLHVGVEWMGWLSSACGVGSSCRSRGRKGGISSRGSSRRQGAPPSPSSPMPGMMAPGGRSLAAGAASLRTGESCSLLPSWGWKRKRQEHWGQVAITECAGARSGGKGRLKPH